MSKQEILEIIDYTLLKPTATRDDIKAFCEETIKYGFKTVFVNPYWVSYAHSLLSPHNIKVGVPIGFSLGGATTHVKVEETKEAIKNGAEEIDMLINIGALKSGDYDVVRDDIAAVVKAAGGLTTKVIIETFLLTDEEKVKATELIAEAGADFVKTATGFNGGGATVEDVKLLHKTANGRIQVKAAGGVKTMEDAIKIVEAGATRIGASGAVAIIQGEVSQEAY